MCQLFEWGDTEFEWRANGWGLAIDGKNRTLGKRKGAAPNCRLVTGKTKEG